MDIVADEPAVDLIAVSRDSPPGIAPREVWQSARSSWMPPLLSRRRRSGQAGCRLLGTRNGFDPAVQHTCGGIGPAYAAGHPGKFLEGPGAFVRHWGRVAPVAAVAPRGPARSHRPGPERACSGDLAFEPAHAGPSPPRDKAACLTAYGIPVTRRGASPRSAKEAVEHAEGAHRLTRSSSRCSRRMSPTRPRRARLPTRCQRRTTIGARRAFKRVIRRNVSRHAPGRDNRRGPGGRDGGGHR